ncbi:MAG: 30S ribosomal protein S3 [Candidatus Pacearchaeota archaeon]|nr:MAG: 30S ribosomal protein S3 [Candidatus Pacearchaeota archaeon]
MIKKKFIEAKKQEFEIKEFIKTQLGKGRVSDIKIERTPVGEKIVIITSRPGLVIGRGGEIIQKVNTSLKKRFKLENPQIEVSEIQEAIFDAQTVADQIALSLERFGPLSFKLIAYRELDGISKAGALGAEIRLSGRLPSERSRSWRFAFGYLSKTGAIADIIVNRAQAKAFTRPGVVGVKVAIVPRDAKIPDKISISKKIIEEEIKEKLKKAEEEAEVKTKKKAKSKEKKKRKKTTKKKKEVKEEKKGGEEEAK